MKQLRLSLLTILFAMSLVASSPNGAKACSGSTSLHALEICYEKCRDLYPGNTVWESTARSACYAGCNIGCLIYGVE